MNHNFLLIFRRGLGGPPNLANQDVVDFEGVDLLIMCLHYPLVVASNGHQRKPRILRLLCSPKKHTCIHPLQLRTRKVPGLLPAPPPRILWAPACRNRKLPCDVWRGSAKLGSAKVPILRFVEVCDFLFRVFEGLASVTVWLYR